MKLPWALAVIPTVALAFTACHRAPGPETPSRVTPWSGPRSPVLRLVDVEGRVTGEALPDDAGVLARWDRAGLLEDWEIESTETSITLTLPRVSAAAGNLRSAVVTLRPGHADQVVVEPLVYRSETGLYQTALEKAFRTVRVRIPADARPDESLSFSVPLGEAATGNWHDAAAPCTMTGLRVTASSTQAISTTIEEIVFVGERTALSGRPAVRSSIEIGGVVRPAWMVASGAKVRFDLHVPEGDPVLRWYDGIIGEVGPRTVRIVGDEPPAEIRVEEGAGPWHREELSLGKWAGSRITLELSTLPPRGVDGIDGQRVARGIGIFGTPEVSTRAEEDPAPDILIYLIDALRADHIGAWGYERAKTPNLDRLAGSGATFTNLISSSCWTKPAVVTLMTAIQPTTHGVGSNSSLDLLPDGVPLLQEQFEAGGWRTGSFLANPLAGTLSRLERGFDAAYLPRYWTGRIGSFLHPTAGQLHESLLSWVDEAPRRPFFAYVHTLEVHQSAMPYNVGDGTETMSPYDLAVSRADSLLGGLLDGLADRNRFDNLVLIILSDHGESLGEHGNLGHGQSLYQSEIHVPLIIWSPARIPAVAYDTPVALADVGPTLLELSGLGPLPGAQGSSLASVLRGEAANAHEFVNSSLEGFSFIPAIQDQYSLVDGEGEKLMSVPGLRRYAFNLADDPLEDTPILDVPPASSAEFETWLEEQRSARRRFERAYGPSARSSLVSAEDVESLRTLGYVP